MMTPTAIDALYGAAMWLLDERRPRDAMDVFRAMLLSAPDDERCWLGLGAAHEAIGELDVAVRLYELCAHAARQGRCDIARARLLRSLDRADEADLAIEDAERFIEQNDDDFVRALIVHERASS